MLQKDMYEAGGVPMLLKTLLEGGYLHGDCKTVTGKSLGDNLEEITFNPDQKVIYPVIKSTFANWRRC